MEPTDALFSIAEVSIAIVGFAGIVAALRPTPRDGEQAEMNRWRLEVMVETGVGAVVFALVPVLLIALDLPRETIWSVSGVASAAGMCFFLFHALRSQQRLFGAYIPAGSGVTDGAIISLTAASVICAVLNALGITLERQFAGHLVTEFCWLAVALLAFFRILLAGRRRSARADAPAEGAAPAAATGDGEPGG